MNIRHLILRSISWYKSFYRLIAIAIAVAVAVIVGSLVVGDSVRGTLIKRVEERLGKTETIIFSQYSYLNDAILESLRVGAENFPPVRGVLLINGFVSISGKLTPVTVWGVDDLGIMKGQAKINPALYNEIKTSQTQHIVLRLPSAGMVPLGSMFVTDTYTTSLRLELDSTVPVEQGGNINLKNEQTIPFNIFVNREELAETMDIPDKVNVILSDRIISKEDFTSAWSYTQSGLTVRHSAHEVESPEKSERLWVDPVTTIVSDRIFIQGQVVETLCRYDSASNRIYTYLANSIRKNDNSIPYSFITAVDYYRGRHLNPDEIILSDYAAQRLNVGLNDIVSVSYFVSRQFKTLIVDSVFLKVGKIVPLADLQTDNSLRADFPGLSNVERCTNWNSDLPINMKLITAEDEDYWAKYKNTPKALVPYSTLAPRWENAYGSATALQINDMNRLKDLSYEMFDIQLIYPREAGITAAKSGVDFSSLFLSLGFFIIISAAMLMMVPLSEMLFRRRDEINLLKATGFSDKRILQLLLRESAPLVFISAILGVIVGLLYTYLILFLLGNVWKGATHTDGFNVYFNLTTIVIGMLSGIILSLLLLYIGIFRALKKKDLTAKLTKDAQNSQIENILMPKLCENSLRILWLKKLLKSLSISIFIIGLLVINIFFVKSPILFICSGIAFLFVGWAWVDYLINNGAGARHALHLQFNTSKLMWSSLFYTKKQAMLSFITLASGVFIVFSVGLNRQGFADSSQIRTATGGFSLWCETSVPVYHNLQTEEGRAKLALNDLFEETQIIQLLKYSADDASCLNLNKVVTPNVLGIDMDELKNSDFKIAKTIYGDSGFDKLKTAENSVYPALVDETVLMWSLGKNLGDTIVYTGEKGENISIQLAGTLQNSIFQGYILIDKTLFADIWSEISGSEIMLVKVPDTEIDDTKMLISQALNNYGVRIMTTNERLKMFYSVTDTYLTIFLTLGGLGLLLGIFSFIIVVRKNILARTKEITLYRALGFNEKRILNLLYEENIIIPLYAIFTGALGSLLGVSMGLSNVSIGIWALAIAFLVIFIFCIIAFVKNSIKNYLLLTINY